MVGLDCPNHLVDSSDDEDDSKPEIKKPQDDLDDFLDDVSAQPGDYEAL